MSVQEIETAILSLPPQEQDALTRWLAGRRANTSVDLSDEYRAMAQDAAHEAEAVAWAEQGTADVGREL